MRAIEGLKIEIDIGDAADQRLVGLTRHGRGIAAHQGHDGFVSALVALTSGITCELGNHSMVLSQISVIPRHLGRGLELLAAGFWRPKVTVYLIRTDPDNYKPPTSW